jgi:hypothetical protein
MCVACLIVSATQPPTADDKRSQATSASTSANSNGGDGDKSKPEQAASASTPPLITDVYRFNPIPSKDAVRIASVLNGVTLTGVVKVLVADESTLVFLLDRTKLSSCPKASDKDAARASGSGAGAAETGPAGKAAKPSEAGGNASRQNKNQSAACKPAQQFDVKALEKQIDDMIGKLSGLPPPSATIVRLPPGAKATELAASSQKIPGIISATAVGDEDLYLVYDSKTPDAHELVKALLQPMPPQKHIEGGVQRLYYISGDTAGAAVAKLLNDIYPDVSSSFLPPDTIQMSMPNPPKGLRAKDYDSIEDARRMIAKLDQPRPRASMDAWAIQIASEDPRKLERVTPRVEELTSAYNEVLTKSLLAGWKKLVSSSHLDSSFADYISNVAVSDTNGHCCLIGVTPQSAADNPLFYALGYQSMFEPSTPNLIDMLVNLIAQQQPRQVTHDVINEMEGEFAPAYAKKLVHLVQQKREKAHKDDKTSLIPWPPHKGPDQYEVESQSRVPDTTPDGGLGRMLCRQRDQEIYRAFVDRQHVIEGKWRLSHCHNGTCEKNPGLVVPPNLVLSCVRKVMEDSLLEPFKSDDSKTSEFGQMRAAITDFLFQYKMMVMYPDDFHAYLLPMSVDNLDMALLPIVEAFNDDLGAFQEAFQKQIYDLLQADGVSYSSSGIVSMKMIAGNQAIADSTTQNSFPVSQVPQAGEVAKAVAELKTEPDKGAADLFKALQPVPVTASLGKQLTLTSTIHSLSGAYGMELDLVVNATESGTPKLVEKGSSTPTDDLNSRVTKHSIQTKIRVDNFKLFEVSTMRSLVARGQKPWKPFDPVVEIPLLGYLVNRPKHPLSVYTQSLIFIDALVVPTAIDLGYGVAITGDLRKSCCSPPEFSGVQRLAELADDHSQYRIEAFHNKLVACQAKEYLYWDSANPDFGASIRGCDLRQGNRDCMQKTREECDVPIILPKGAGEESKRDSGPPGHL